MEFDPWLERWRTDNIRFHKDEVNGFLRRYANELQARDDDTVLVPLCGKSLDMAWLRDQGLPVVGIELSDKAASAFFAEQDQTPYISTTPRGRWFEADDIRILCADFFAVTPADIGPTRRCFDRAALVAMPESRRPPYAAKLQQLLQDDTRMLLITMEYDQREMDGPPFAVSEEEVRELYGQRFEVRRLDAMAILEQEPHFRDKGLTALREACYLLYES